MIKKSGELMDAQTEQIVYFLAHSFAMLSTITNPIMYGWLNTNLKHLFRAMIPTVRNEREDGKEPEYDEYLPIRTLRYKIAIFYEYSIHSSLFVLVE